METYCSSGIKFLFRIMISIPKIRSYSISSILVLYEFFFFNQIVTLLIIFRKYIMHQLDKKNKL